MKICTAITDLSKQLIYNYAMPVPIFYRYDYQWKNFIVFTVTVRF